MPRIKMDDEIKISAEEPKPRRGRRRKNSETPVVEKPKRTRAKKISEEPKVTEVEEIPKIDYKNDGREKIFALDIGTRSVIGIVAEQEEDGRLTIIATRRREHTTRAMLDGQIHDVPQVAAVINQVRDELEEKVGKLTSAAVAAAGRALYTMTAVAETEVHGLVTAEQQSNLDFAGVQLAQSQLSESRAVPDEMSYYCVGFSVINYELDGSRLKSLVGQRGRIAKARVIATFLPRQVIDSMQSALKYSGLEMRALTLEPIAAINVLIPPTMRHLNLVLVDIGAGTSDVAITKNGSVIAYGMVPVAGDEITEALSQKFLLDFNVAEDIKRKSALGEKSKFTDILGGSHDLTAEEIVTAITDSIIRLAEAISKTVLELNGGEVPQAVMLVGGGALTPNLQKHVAAALSIPEPRVGVRKPDVVEGIVNIPRELYSPDAITPLGILKVASIHTLHFLTVYINDVEYSLFHFKDLTIGDAFLNAGIRLSKWNGKPGLGLMITVDGERKFFRGSMGTLAEVTVDGEPATLETPIKNKCFINIERGKDGKIPELRLGDVVTPEPGITVEINGLEEIISPKITVNDEVSLPTRLLKDGDVIQTVMPRTIGEVLRLTGYPPTGRKISYTLNGKKYSYTCTPKILMDDGEVQISLPVHDGDKIEYYANDSPKAADIIKISEINSSIKIFYGGQEFKIPTMASITLTVNNRPANMNTLINDGATINYRKIENNAVTVSDALLAVDFQPPPPKSRISFSIKVNDLPADFASPMRDGDTLEIILKAPDGTILPSTSGVEVPIKKDINETILPSVKIPANSTPMRELTTRRKLTIQDFIRND